MHFKWSGFTVFRQTIKKLLRSYSILSADLFQSNWECRVVEAVHSSPLVVKPKQSWVSHRFFVVASTKNERLFKCRQKFLTCVSKAFWSSESVPFPVVLFCFLSRCVSANLTTMGLEHPWKTSRSSIFPLKRQFELLWGWHLFFSVTRPTNNDYYKTLAKTTLYRIAGV